MTLVVLASASGAPGVSSAVLGLALAWPRPVLLVEADPTGGSTILAGWLHGHPPHHRGLLNLAMVQTHGSLAEAIPEVVVRLPGTSVDVVPAVRSHTQAVAVAPLWPGLAATLAGMDATGVDVLVDAGRLGMQHAPVPVVQAADLMLLTSRATLPAVSAARGWARDLRERFQAVGAPENAGALLVGPGHTFGAGEVAQVLDLPLVATLPWDPRTARALHLGETSRRLRTGPLTRALRVAAQRIDRLAAANRARLATAAPIGQPSALQEGARS